MEKKSWAKADGTSAVVVELIVEGKRNGEYQVEVSPNSAYFSVIYLKRSQIALVIAALQEVLNAI